jgi:glycosyltransferase involved in cell wall biosynthesis
MRIAIDLVIAEKKPGGMLFATRALLEGLARIDKQNEYIIITSKPKEYQKLAAAPNIHIQPVKLYTWRAILIQHQIIMPRVLRKLQPDVLHVPAFVSPIGWKGPLVITIHDLAFLKTPDQISLRSRIYWQYMLHESVRHAQRIIVVSEQTRSELTSMWAIEPERICLVHNALRPSLRWDSLTATEIEEMRKRYGNRYLLHVGRIVPRKNVEKLVQAFDLLASRLPDLHLVLAGGAGFGSESVLELIAASPFHERIHQVGWVPENDLGPLYAGASALVFPSSHEGFGIPTIEAMACGTPVVASPEAASLEIASEAVLRTDCSDPAQLADSIAEMLSDEKLRGRLIQLGRIQSRAFTCEACAVETRQAYQEAWAMDARSKQMYVLG